MNGFISVAGFEKTFRYVKLFEQGLVITVMLALFTVLIGFVLGIILAVLRMTDIRPFRFLAYERNGRIRNNKTLIAISKFNPIAFLATAYVEIIRSTPVLVQILIIYHGVFGKLIDLPDFTIFGFIKFKRFFPGVVALGMNSGAYLCEILRSGIQSIGCHKKGIVSPDISGFLIHHFCKCFHRTSDSFRDHHCRIIM